MTQAGMNVLGAVAPPLAGRWAYDLFRRPARFRDPAWEAEIARKAERRWHIPFGDGRLAALGWGEGPLVLLVHGWSGRGTQLGAFVAPLVAAAYSVVAFDAPAHGRSTGRRTNLFEVADSVRHVAAQAGPVTAVVAHSFGAAATTLALGDGMEAGGVAFLGPACRASQAVKGFARQLGLTLPVELGLRGELERSFGTSVWQETSAANVARSLKIPALLIHDLEDREVPYREAQILAHSWPGARLHTTAGLGHRRILRDPATLTEVVSFLKGLAQ
jgi:pimeloyl-ACP methyl ester carboxylesterase